MVCFVEHVSFFLLRSKLSMFLDLGLLENCPTCLSFENIFFMDENQCMVDTNVLDEVY